ncbi:MAG: bacterioferritin [Deltaproteobacteria bacterium]|nr:bacterioferritin [Deltaproteobacteria bacterium]
MKGNETLIRKLDELLCDELTAINQYMVHSEMCANWGYNRLHKTIEKRAIEEMKHAEKLIGRILFLEGTPTVSKLNAVLIGADVAKQLESDLNAELGAIRDYNDAIKLANEVGDAVSRKLLEEILRDEDAHIDWLEEQRDQINQMGIALYLTTQTSE